jgi:hypothetical protein
MKKFSASVWAYWINMNHFYDSWSEPYRALFYITVFVVPFTATLLISPYAWLATMLVSAAIAYARYRYLKDGGFYDEDVD